MDGLYLDGGEVMFPKMYLKVFFTQKILFFIMFKYMFKTKTLINIFSDLSHSDTRLSVMLNGFELHVYNRCQLYAQLEKTFGLTSQMFVDEENHNINSDDHDIESFSNTTHETRQQINAMDVSRHVDNIRKKEAHVIARTWRDLIPVIKLDVCTVST